MNIMPYISKTSWKNFKKYRTQEYLKVMSSEGYQKIQEKRQKVFRTRDPFAMAYDFGQLDLLEKGLFVGVPDITIESYLDWVSDDI